MDLDAFLGQFVGLLRRRLAVDRAMLLLAVVHLARFVGELGADVFRVSCQVIAQFVSAVVFKQKTSAREALGIALVIAGVVLLLWSH